MKYTVLARGTDCLVGGALDGRSFPVLFYMYEFKRSSYLNNPTASFSKIDIAYALVSSTIT